MNIPEFRKHLLTVVPQGFKVYSEMLLKDLKPFAIGLQVLQGRKRGLYYCGLYVYTGNQIVLPPLIFDGNAEEVEHIIIKLKEVLQANSVDEVLPKIEAYLTTNDDLTAVNFGK